MIKRCKYIFLTILIISLFVPSMAYEDPGFDQDASKGTNNRGQAGYLFLLRPTNARQMALQESDKSGCNSAMMMFDNVAEIIELDGLSLAYTRQQLYDSLLMMNNFAITNKLSKRFAIGVTIRQMNSEEMKVTTLNDPDGESGLTYTYQDLAIGAGFAYRPTTRFSIGAKLKLISESIHTAQSTSFGFDVSTLYRLDFLNSKLSAGLENYGPESDFSGSGLWNLTDLTPENQDVEDTTDVNRKTQLLVDEFPLPTKIHVGFSSEIIGEKGFNVKDSVGRLSATLLKTNDQFESFSFGFEYKYQGLNRLELVGRAGAKYHQESDYNTGMGIGFGLNYEMQNDSNLNISYAYSPHEDLDSSHLMTIGFLF